MASSHSFILAEGAADAALLTLGIALYSAIILIGIGVGVYAVTHGRRTLAIAMAVLVGVLTVTGVILAVASSIH
ncbi:MULTISPECIES: hypothetical protein [unclassified Gordonia (in: high G+C Gram-positive bacteria)]